jgi:hypothetical protein
MAEKSQDLPHLYLSRAFHAVHMILLKKGSATQMADETPVCILFDVSFTRAEAGCVLMVCHSWLVTSDTAVGYCNFS